jgi:hypothetical protein
MNNDLNWKRLAAGVYVLRDGEDATCAHVEREEESGRWGWWLTSHVTDNPPVGHSRTLPEAKSTVLERYELATSLPGIISGGVQRLMSDKDKPVEQRAAEAVKWIESWVRVEVGVLG